MTRNTKLKIAAAASAAAAGAVGGLTLGPAGAVAGALGALSTFLLGLFHDKPQPKDPSQ